MVEDRKCSNCGSIMKKIPVKKIDSTMLIEFYCDKCDESITFYPSLDRVKIGRASFF